MSHNVYFATLTTGDNQVKLYPCYGGGFDGISVLARYNGLTWLVTVVNFLCVAYYVSPRQNRYSVSSFIGTLNAMAV